MVLVLLFFILLLYLPLICAYQLVTVLVSWGCCNKLPWTRWLVNNRNLFLTVLDAGSPRSSGQHSQVLVRTLFQVADCQHLVSSRGRAQREEASSLVAFIRTHLTHRDTLPNPNYLPKVLPSSIIILWGRVSIYEFWGTQTVHNSHQNITILLVIVIAQLCT